jgi:hypothetical protein
MRQEDKLLLKSSRRQLQLAHAMSNCPGKHLQVQHLLQGDL